MSGPFQLLHERSVAEHLPLADWAKAVRGNGWDTYFRAGLPQRTHEEWKYTSLRSIGELTFTPATALAPFDTKVAHETLSRYTVADDLTIVFVNGILSTGLSCLSALPAGVTVIPVSEALEKDDASLRAALDRQGTTLRHQHGVHAFGALSDAFLRDGVILDFARGTKIDRTLHIVHIVTPDAHDRPTAYFPRHVIRLGERAEANVVETFCAASLSQGQRDAGPYLVTAFTDVILGNAARLCHLRVQAEASTGIHVGLIRAALERDSYLGTFSLAAGGRLARVDLDITLKASGADVDLDGLYLVRGSQHVDHHTVVEHLVPNATSRQLYKGILSDSARAVFNGKVIVREGAHGTNAFQLNQNLLLSSDAEIDTKPELQIDADDVKCSHGAAIGQLDADQIFYLQSRGLTRAEAQKLLCAAFADEVLLKVKTPGRFESLKRLTTDYVTL
jgi:Fe-S cluster assembly protein SufD